MAGRGKSSAIIQIASALHVERNEIKSQPQSLQPIPTYPPKEPCQLPLVEENDFFAPLDYDYISQMKSECLTAFKDGPYYVESDGVKRDIERYTDRLRKTHSSSFDPDWSRVPKELMLVKKQKLLEPVKKQNRKINPLNFDVLEKREAEGFGEKDAEGSDGSDTNEDEELEEKKKEIPPDDEEIAEEEEDEEFTDYANTYFDNGEDYAEDSADDNPDEATY